MRSLVLALILAIIVPSVKEARVIVFGGSRSSSSSRPDPRNCVEWKYVENDLWRCITKQMQEVERKYTGVKPAFKCEFTKRAHTQYGFCKDGKGVWKTDLRDSGPHPRDRFNIR